MSVNVLIITHEEIGSALINAATTTLGELPLPTTVITINYDTDPEDLIPRLKEFIHTVGEHNGILILTDLFGSTPSNIALQLRELGQIKIVSGLNLPMLIRVMNYPQLDLKALTAKACSGGRDGVMDCCGEKHD